MEQTFASIRDALAAQHPAAPWLALWLATFAACYAIRRWLPGVWSRAFFWVPADAPAMARQAAQGFVAALPATMLASIASGMSWRHALLGAAAGAMAPVAHHVSKAYRGEVGR